MNAVVLRNRSWLFVPGDSSRKIDKASSAGADALIFDLEDAVTAERRPVARELIGAVLEAPSAASAEQWVRVNPLDSGETLADLVAVVRPHLAGVVLPKIADPSDVVTLDHYLSALESVNDLDGGSIRIAVVATETPQMMFRLGGLTGCSRRLAACTWGAEDLSAAVGAITNKGDDDLWDTPYQLARSLCLFAATSAGVQPVDTLFADFNDDDGLAASTALARRQGFTGKLAIHPRQVPIINRQMTPSSAEVADAEAVVAAFAAAGGAGTVALGGRMLDRPHLTQAEHILAAARLDSSKGLS